MNVDEYVINDIIYPQVSICANLSYEIENDNLKNNIQPEVKLAIQSSDDDYLNCRAILSYELKNKNNLIPYSISIVGIVYYQINEKILTGDQEKDDERHAVISGKIAHDLFLSLRDYIATITSRSVYGSYFISDYHLEDSNIMSYEDF